MTIGTLLGRVTRELLDYERGNGLTESHRAKAAAASLVAIVEYVEGLEFRIRELEGAKKGFPLKPLP